MFKLYRREISKKISVVGILALNSILFHFTAVANAQVADTSDSVEIVVKGHVDDDVINVRGGIISPDAEVRLYTVGYRLAVANTDCKDPQMQTGLVANDIGYYDESRRAELSKNFDFTYGFMVIAVVRNSAAARSGLMPGDEILKFDGVDVRAYRAHKLGREPYPWRAMGLQYNLAEALQKGPVKLVVRRSGVVRDITLTGQSGCGGLVRLNHFEEGRNLDLGRNIWYDGMGVAVSERLINFTKSDDELAFIVAHTMAHNLAGDYFKMTGHFPFRHPGMTLQDSLIAEKKADDTAIDLLVKASYKPLAMTAFLKRAANVNWLYEPANHPNFSTRVLAIEQYAER